jgi:hypothetical protein
MAMTGMSDDLTSTGSRNRRELRKVAVEQGMNVGCTKSGVWKTRRYGVWWRALVVVLGVANGRFPGLFQAGGRSNFRSINNNMDMFPALFWSAVFLRN